MNKGPADMVVSWRKMSIEKYARLAIVVSGSMLAAASGHASNTSVAPQALEHYAYCISEAKDRNNVFDLDRHIMYRCHGEVAISYFNYLGRMRVRDQIATEFVGTFIYRDIEGVGRCWNKIAYPSGAPVSIYGCDVYVEI